MLTGVGSAFVDSPLYGVTGSVAVINIGDCICSPLIPTIFVVLPPTSIPITALQDEFL